MTHLYDVMNQSKKGMWILAEDRVDASLVAQQLGHVKEMENAVVSGPFDQIEGLEVLKSFDDRGQVAKDLDTQTWFLFRRI